MTISKVIGEKIRLKRNEKGINREELAHLSSLSEKYIGEVERGEKNITVDSLNKITNALEINLEEFFRFNESLEKNYNPSVLVQIIEKLNNRSVEEQEYILELLDVALKWVDKEK